MKKIDTKNIIAVVDGNDWSELRYATKDGEQAFILEEPLEDGTEFIVPDEDEEVVPDEDDEEETGAYCIHVHGEAAPLRAWRELSNIYAADEELWELEANDMLACIGFKLGDEHRMTVVIEANTYDNGWYDLQTL